MSGAASGPPGRKGSSGAEAIDLDMTPMMNMLIILISFLVTMVVFTHLAVLQFDLPSSGDASAGAAAPSAGPETDLTVMMSEAGFQIIGAGQKRDPIPRNQDGYDFAGLGRALGQLHSQVPAARSIVLLIAPEVLYQDIISAMDACRENRFPDVLLSGGVSG